MELEYRDDGRRGKFVVVIGVILALMAGGAAFYFVSQAQQQAGQSTVQRVPAVVAVQTIPARTAITAADVTVREIPIDATNANGLASDPQAVIGRVPAVTILQGQVVTTNMLASAAEGAKFSILRPEETLGPDSQAWRAISITVADDLAVGGLLEAGQTVDVFVTAVVQVPQPLVQAGKYYTDRSTKITYQDMLILARESQFYILRADVPIAEEILHLQASGNVTFSMALRPEVDTRAVDASKLGETTNRIITKYQLPIPETYPSSGGAPATLPPLPEPTAFPTPTPEPDPSPAAGSSPSPTP
jgi:Flp pilus assembly protein CpaB